VAVFGAAAAIVALVAVMAVLRDQPVQDVDTGPAVASQPNTPLSGNVDRTPLDVAEVRTHLVVPGDTVAEVAERYRVTVEGILAANPTVVASMLAVGSELVIPAQTAEEQAPQDTSADAAQGGELQLASGPIGWPDGSTDVVETVARFLDEYFPEWRDQTLTVQSDAADGAADVSSADATISHADGGTFATVQLSFGDGRWFIDSFESPLLNVALQSSDRTIAGTVSAGVPGRIEIAVVYAFERQFVNQASIAVGPSDAGRELPVAIGSSHREVHLRLVSPTGELTGIAALNLTHMPGSAQSIGTENAAVEGAGYWLTREQRLEVQLAEFALMNDCVAEQGQTFTWPTEDELIHHHGQWQPNGVLGIGRTLSAQALGYRDAKWGGFGSPIQGAAYDALDPSQQTAYVEAVRVCTPQVSNGLTDSLRLIDLWHQLIGSDGTQGAQWRAIPCLSVRSPLGRTVFDSSSNSTPRPRTSWPEAMWNRLIR